MGMGTKDEQRPHQVVCYRLGKVTGTLDLDRLGIENLKLAHWLGWSTCFCGSFGCWIPRTSLLELRPEIEGRVRRKAGEDMCDPLEKENVVRGHSRWSSTDMGMSLGDWIWRKRVKGDGLQLADEPTSSSFMRGNTSFLLYLLSIVINRLSN